MRHCALIALLISTFQLHGQTVDKTYEMGCELFAAGNFSGASAVLSRVVYFDHAGAYKSDCYHKLAQCNLVRGNWLQAQKQYELAIITCKDARKANDLVLEKSVEMIRRKEFFAAMQELYSLDDDLEPDQKYLCNYLIAISLFGNNDYTKSEVWFLSLASNAVDSNQISAIFQKIDKKLDPKRPKRARNMSYFIPGSGQMYAGSVIRSINSIVLIGAIGALYISTVSEYGILSGFITVLPWLSRYHVGGAENAMRTMIDRQAKLKSQYFDSLLAIVSTYPAAS